MFHLGYVRVMFAEKKCMGMIFAHLCVILQAR